MTVAGYQPPGQDIAKGPIEFRWYVATYGVAARAFYMGSDGDCWGFGGLSVNLSQGFFRLPWPVHLSGWEFFQRQAGAFANNVAFDLRRANDTVSLATWSHVSGTTLYSGALDVSLSVPDTLCVRHNNPGQAAGPYNVMAVLTVWGERT